MRRLTMVLLAVVVCTWMGCGMSSQEDTFKWRLKDMDELAAKADPALKAEILVKKAEFEKGYAALPQGEVRGEPLGKLNQQSLAYINDIKAKVKSADVAKEEKAKNEDAAKADSLKMMVDQLKLFAGYWKGVGMELTITEAGSIEYEELERGVKKSGTGTIKEFRKDGFSAKVFIGTANFRINEPPHEVNGKWMMRIDGIELTRLPYDMKPKKTD